VVSSTGVNGLISDVHNPYNSEYHPFYPTGTSLHQGRSFGSFLSTTNYMMSSGGMNSQSMKTKTCNFKQVAIPLKHKYPMAIA